MADSEVSAFNCQTSPLLQRRLIRQLCQDHLFLFFLSPLPMETSCERAVLSDGGCFLCGKQPRKTPSLSSAGVAFQQRSHNAAA